MSIKLKYGGDLILAYMCDYNDINMLMALWSKKCRNAKYSKHAHTGDTIRRRNTKKERNHGQTKSALHVISTIRELATAIRTGLSDFNFDFKNPPVNAKAEAIKILNEIDPLCKVSRKYIRRLEINKGE